MKRTIFLPMAMAAAAACSSAVTPLRDASLPDASAQAGVRTDTVSIQLSKTVLVDGGRLEVKFDTRVADSRCPATAVCIWMGDAHVRVTTRVAGGAPATFDLHSGLEPRAIEVDRYSITMIGMTPYPGTGNDADAPVVILRVSRS